MNKDYHSSIFLYGPPGSGKTSVGKILAKNLNVDFIDLDELIERETNHPIADIFHKEGETAFREFETRALKKLTRTFKGVISLGGGTLLSPENQNLVENYGIVMCLDGNLDTLAERLAQAQDIRPLIENDRKKLGDLLANRADHYRSFSLRLPTDKCSIEQAAWSAQIQLGRYYIRGMGEGYPVFVQNGRLADIGINCRNFNIDGPILIVSDTNVYPLYADTVAASMEEAGYDTHQHVIPAGEHTKTMLTVQDIWDVMIEARIERTSTIIALGGGVTGDLTGFAAATFLRGVKWINVPTSLLAIVDASLGGKTGADLPQGKNLVGAFYPPEFVLADLEVLNTLPAEELYSGMAEIIKHGVVGDPILFNLCRELHILSIESITDIVNRAIAVKVKIINEDPYERSVRAKLNFGHTLGHAIEKVLDFTIRHGEAVSIGMVAATLLSEELGVAKAGLADELGHVLQVHHLPIKKPAGISKGDLVDAMRIDKKRQSGSVNLVLPVDIGEVKYGFPIKDIDILAECS